MASVYKRKRDRGRRGSCWYIGYRDDNGKQRTVKGCVDKAATEAMANKLESDGALRRRGLIDPKAEAYRDHEARSTGEHLAEWHTNMLDSGKTSRHADQYLERAQKLVAITRGASVADLERGRRPEALAAAAAFTASVMKVARLSDLTSERIQSALALLRTSGKSNQTVNHYRAALRAFVLWCWAKGRLRDNPMRGVAGFNVEEDIRHARRCLTDNELARLIQAAATGPELFGMPGPLRALAYRLAAATGFRAEELRSLTPESFRLDGAEPSVVLRASATKNRRSADQPLPTALIEELRLRLVEVPPSQPVLPLHHETAKAIRADLDAVGIPYETDEGVADFHSLRAYYISALVRAGASIAEVRKLARHAKAETTLKHYEGGRS